MENHKKRYTVEDIVTIVGAEAHKQINKPTNQSKNQISNIS